MAKPISSGSSKDWLAYYRYTAKRPPRELLLQTLTHLEWEKEAGRGLNAIELGFGAGTDTLELLRRGWKVLAVDQTESAAKFLAGRVRPRERARLTTLVAPMEGLELPPAHLVYASFSLPFCLPDAFPTLWAAIRRAILPGGHFAGQLFGNEDSWNGARNMSFHSLRQVKKLSQGMKVEMLRETREDGMAFNGPKHWHYFDLILEQPGQRR